MKSTKVDGERFDWTKSEKIIGKNWKSMKSIGNKSALDACQSLKLAEKSHTLGKMLLKLNINHFVTSHLFRGSIWRKLKIWIIRKKKKSHFSHRHVEEHEETRVYFPLSTMKKKLWSHRVKRRNYNLVKVGCEKMKINFPCDEIFLVLSNAKTALSRNKKL